MKTLTLLALILLPLPVAAQTYPGMNMNQQDMQKMMLQAQKAQACMEKVDKKALEAMEQESRQFEAEIRALCAAGKRGQAQEKALAYGRRMTASPVVREMKRCAEMMQGMMKNLVPGMDTRFMNEDPGRSPANICDSLENERQ
ncbi:MAG TPA: hypothetical protein ENK27_01050 [Desulfobulbus sp.]|nr:hypothetical protein [Desulfobulbus sp.]